MILLFISKEILVCFCICCACVVQITSQVCHATVYTFKVLVPSFIYTKYIPIERNTLNYFTVVLSVSFDKPMACSFGNCHGSH